MIPRTMSERRCSVFAVTAALVLFVAITAHLPTGARSSAIRPVSGLSSSSSVVRHKRDTHLIVPTDAVQVAGDAAQDGVVREKRTLHKLKPLVVLPAKLALGAGAKLVAGAKLGAKAVGLGAKALGVGAVGLKAVKKVAKVTVKAATALGIKAVLLNFLFQKINQVIDFKTRLLSNLDQRNKNQNAQFLSPLSPSSGKSSSGSVGNKEDDDFLASSPDDQQVLAQEQTKTSAVAPSATSVAPLVDDDDVTFDANKISLQVPDRLFGPSFTAVNGISTVIGTVIQNTAARFARLIDAIKASIWRKASGVSTISNSSGSFSENRPTSSKATRGSRDAADDLADDGLDPDPLDEMASSKKRSVENSTSANTADKDTMSTDNH